MRRDRPNLDFRVIGKDAQDLSACVTARPCNCDTVNHVHNNTLH
jgi:hypothetical protein